MPTILMVPTVNGGYLVTMTWANGGSSRPTRELSFEDALDWIQKNHEERNCRPMCESCGENRASIQLCKDC